MRSRGIGSVTGRWRAIVPMLAGALLVASCSSGDSTGDTGSEGAAEAGVTTSVPAPTASTAAPSTTQGPALTTTAPTTTPPTTTAPNFPSSISRPDIDPRITISGPGLGGDPVDTIDPSDIVDGRLVFVEETGDGLAGPTVVVTDDELRIEHTLTYDAAPFLLPTGWPHRAILRIGASVGVLDAVSGTTSMLTAAGGGELQVFDLLPGRRYVPAVEVGGANATYLVDLELGELLPIEGNLRSGVPEFSSDGQWVVAVPDMGPRGAGSLAIVRPHSPGEHLLVLEPPEGEVIEEWFFDDAGVLWATSRPLDPRGERATHSIDLATETLTVRYLWSSESGYRLRAVDGDRHILQAQAGRDDLVVDLEGNVLSVVLRPVDRPKVFGGHAAYIDENDVRLVSLETGEIREFMAIGSPTPSEIDFGDEGQFWIADGYAKEEIGLFRIDLSRGTFVDHRDVVASLGVRGEHFFSFDPSRYRTDGRALVVYQGPERSWLVWLAADEEAGASLIEAPVGHRVTDVTLSPTGERALVLSGVRRSGEREATASIIDLELGTLDDFGGRVEHQRVGTWLVG